LYHSLNRIADDLVEGLAAGQFDAAARFAHDRVAQRSRT
jgi:hypothetical protein